MGDISKEKRFHIHSMEKTMRRYQVIMVLAMLSSLPSQASSLEIKNFRLTYGRGGAKRAEMDIVKGDSIFVAFDLLGIEADSSQYDAKLWLYDEHGRKWIQWGGKVAEPPGEFYPVTMYIPDRWQRNGAYLASEGRDRDIWGLVRNGNDRKLPGPIEFSFAPSQSGRFLVEI